MARITVEGSTINEILNWPENYFDDLVLIGKPIVFNIGSAEVLGQFAINGSTLVVELAQIDGGGEGVLPAISKISKHIAIIKNLTSIDCVVHAIDCAQPNLKLRAHLEKTGFEIKEVEGKGLAYYKSIEMIDVSFESELEEINSSMTFHEINKPANASESLKPQTYAIVNTQDKQHIFKIYDTEIDYFFRDEYALWGKWVIIGCGCFVHFIDTDNFKATSFPLGTGGHSYFCSIHKSKELGVDTREDKMLICSGTSLSCFNINADLEWQASNLAVDGITLSDIREGIIFGSAEQDPPGGWVDFEIALSDGSLIKEPKYW